MGSIRFPHRRTSWRTGSRAWRPCWTDMAFPAQRRRSAGSQKTSLTRWLCALSGSGLANPAGSGRWWPRSRQPNGSGSLTGSSVAWKRPWLPRRRRRERPGGVRRRRGHSTDRPPAMRLVSTARMGISPARGPSPPVAPSGSPFEGHDLPDTPRLVQPRSEAMQLGCRDDQVWRMQEDPELPSRHSKPEVGQAEREPRPPTTIGKAHHQHAPGVIGGLAGEPGHVRIAADDTVHHHEVSRPNAAAGLGEVHYAALDAVLVAGLAKQVSRDIFVGRSQLNADSAAEPVFQQLDLDGPDPAAHIDQRPIFDTFPLQDVDDAPGSGVEAPSPVAPRIGPGAPLAEDLSVALR